MPRRTKQTVADDTSNIIKDARNNKIRNELNDKLEEFHEHIACYLQKKRKEDGKRFDSLESKFSRKKGFPGKIADKLEEAPRGIKSGDVPFINNNNDTTFNTVPPRNINVNTGIHIDAEMNKNSGIESNEKINKNKPRIIATSNPSFIFRPIDSIKPDTFDASVTAIRYLEHFEIVSNHNGWTDQIKLSYLGASLRGKA